MNTENPIIENLELNQSISQTTTYKDQIETVIDSVADKDTAMIFHDKSGYLWKFQKGSAEIFVQLTGEKAEDLLTVWSVVLDLPSKNDTELMKKLLEMNWSGTFETSFAIFNNKVVLSSQRIIEDISPAEISRLITLVATLADDNDDVLQEEFAIS